jgi:hypothetical protein
LFNAVEGGEEGANPVVLQDAGAEAGAIELLGMVPANAGEDGGMMAEIGKVSAFEAGIGKGSSA